MTKAKKSFQPLTSEHVFLVYESLLKRRLVSFPITEESKNKLESIVSTVNGSYAGQKFYETVEEKAVAYFFFIINDHVFTDGNKRTAVIAFSLACVLNDIKHNGAYPLDSVAVFIESIREDDHHSVIKMLAGLLFS